MPLILYDDGLIILSAGNVLTNAEPCLLLKDGCWDGLRRVVRGCGRDSGGRCRKVGERALAAPRQAGGVRGHAPRLLRVEIPWEARHAGPRAPHVPPRPGALGLHYLGSDLPR